MSQMGAHNRIPTLVFSPTFANRRLKKKNLTAINVPWKLGFFFTVGELKSKLFMSRTNGKDLTT